MFEPETISHEWNCIFSSVWEWQDKTSYTWNEDWFCPTALNHWRYAWMIQHCRAKEYKILIECVYVANAGALMCLCMWMCVLYLWISCAVVAGMYPWSQSSHWANCQRRPAGSANTAALLSRGFSGALCVWHKRSGWESLTSTAIRWGFQTNMWKDTLHFPQNCYGWISDESTIYSTLTCMMTIEKK